MNLFIKCLCHDLQFKRMNWFLKALRSFCVALHLNPADEELRSEDLDWTFNLLQQKLLVERELKERELNPTIVEVETD